VRSAAGNPMILENTRAARAFERVALQV